MCHNSDMHFDQIMPLFDLLDKMHSTAVWLTTVSLPSNSLSIWHLKDSIFEHKY